MATNSSIEWTDTTWQVTAGCSRCSEGCRHCYAETMAGRLAAMAVADEQAGRDPGKKRSYRLVVKQKPGTGRDGYGPKSGWNGKLELLYDNLGEPTRWRKPRRVFVNSESDLFHERVPFDFIDLVFAAMAMARDHTFQVLTKRTGRMARYFAERSWGDVIASVRDPDAKEAWVRDFTSRYAIDDVFNGTREGALGYYEPGKRGPFMPQAWPLPNVWLGTSVENQKAADERIPHLLKCPAAVRFLSCEPLLGPVDLMCIRWDRDGARMKDGSIHYGTRSALHSFEGFRDGSGGLPCVDWVIVGGESGPGARPCHCKWVKSIVEQCKAAAVPVFVKQLGRLPIPYWVDEFAGAFGGGKCSVQLGPNDAVLKDPKGGDPEEWPKDLRVREFPETEAAPRGRR